MGSRARKSRIELAHLLDSKPMYLLYCTLIASGLYWVSGSVAAVALYWAILVWINCAR